MSCNLHSLCKTLKETKKGCTELYNLLWHKGHCGSVITGKPKWFSTYLFPLKEKIQRTTQRGAGGWGVEEREKRKKADVFLNN